MSQGKRSTPGKFSGQLCGTLYLQFAYGDIRWSCVSFTCRKGSCDADGHFLLHLFCPIMLTCFISMLTDCLINYFSLGKLDSVRNTLPWGYQGVMFLPIVGR